MPSSDSEDFESADEGQSNTDKKERKQRLSSSNYSDNALETESVIPAASSHKDKTRANVEQEKTTDGWDDFDIDENEPTNKCTMDSQSTKVEKPPSATKAAETKEYILVKKPSGKPSLASESTRVSDTKERQKSQDTGWDDFDDWGDDATTETVKKDQPIQQTQPEPAIQEVTDRFAATSTNSFSSGWGWGWGVDSLLSSATAGITTLTNQVSQGISTVLESGIGAPDPEELARETTKDAETRASRPDEALPIVTDKEAGDTRGGTGDAAFPFGNIFSGVTKFVESTSTKVIAGGLDTLETIGKKTMEVLQDGDPGLAKKRAMLGLDAGDKPVLSQVLREAKAKAEEEDRIREEKREAKEVHYENLFDDFEGLVHLEALEMLSRQVGMRIEERLRSVEPDKKQDIKETLQQVAELCEMPEEDEDDEEPSEDVSRPDAFHERLQTATQDLGLKLQFQPIVKQYTDILAWLSTTESDLTDKSIYKRAVSGLAQATALSVEIYHKSAEMLLVKTRRSTADEADALTQMTVVLTKHISELATLFTEKLNSIPTENKDQVNTYITNIFLEAGNSSTYIQNAFQLALPILQIGAV